MNIKKLYGRMGNGHDPPAIALLKGAVINIAQGTGSILLSKMQSKTYNGQ